MSAQFVRELLLGAATVRPADRREIARYLREVVEQRGFPLQLASLWNALYFEWDLDEAGYVAAGLNPDRVCAAAFGATDEAVPVGAFVRVARGEGEVWAEVVYKEGRHPAIGPDGIVPPGVSGARAELVGDPPHAEIREALILDFDAFGPAWNDRRDIERFKRRGALDAFGQITMTGCYEANDAELDDAAYYARYLLRHHRDGLLAEFVDPAIDDEDLFALLLVSFGAIAEILRDDQALATFNAYFFSERDYRAAVGAGDEGPVGADLFATLYTGIVNPPRGQRVAYAATSQRIVEYLTAGGLEPADWASLSGPGWGRLAVYANHYVAEHVTSLLHGMERGYGGACHVRRDDAWQAGGIWRTERVEGNRLPDVARLPPLMALGLGADEARRAGQTAPTFTPEELPAVPIAVDASSRRWIAVLTAAEIDAGSLRLGETACRWLVSHGQGQLRFKLGEETRPGQPLINELVAYDARRAQLTGIAWGWEVFPGVRLFCSAQDGGLVVRAYLRRLDRPALVAGERLEFEYDESYVGRARRRARLDAREVAGASSLRELIARAFRARGEALPEGARRLTGTELVAATVGLDADPATISLVLLTVGEMDIADDGAGTLTWRPVISRRTRTIDLTLIRDVGARGLASARWLRPRVVRMHLRWQHPSPDKVAGYREALRTYGAWGRLASDLPEGRTWVKRYEAGGNHLES
jgi:hypothetical protein